MNACPAQEPIVNRVIIGTPAVVILGKQRRSLNTVRKVTTQLHNR